MRYCFKKTQQKKMHSIIYYLRLFDTNAYTSYIVSIVPITCQIILKQKPITERER